MSYNNFFHFRDNVIKADDKVKVFLPCIQWYTANNLYQRPQHMATEFQKKGYITIYITLHEELEDEYVLRNGIWFTRNLEETMCIKGAYYTFYSTSWDLDYSRIQNIIKYNKGFVIYDYIDHIDEKINHSKENCDILTKNKIDALCSADLVIATATLLYDEAKKKNNNVELIPNGVCVEHYLSKKDNIGEYRHQKYYDLLYFKNRFTIVIGYFGAIAPWLDYEMINNIMSHRKYVGFVFIGPDYLDSLKKINRGENCLYLDTIPYSVLPYYANLFDICLIPFEKGEIAKTTSPLKLYEYFAVQKPVIVCSDMKECVKYKEVLIYDTLDDLDNKISQANTLKNDKEYKERLLELANENSWSTRVDKLIEWVDKNV